MIMWNINILNKSNELNLLNALKNLSEGKVNKSLEIKLSKLLKVKYVSLFTSGSVALLVAMIACDLKENDEIIYLIVDGYLQYMQLFF